MSKKDKIARMVDTDSGDQGTFGETPVRAAVPRDLKKLAKEVAKKPAPSLEKW